MAYVYSFPVTKKEIVPGSSFYFVRAIIKLDGNIEVFVNFLEVLKSPYILDLGMFDYNIELFEVRYPEESLLQTDCLSPIDANIGNRQGANVYSLHQFFRTKEEAEDYKNRIQKLSFIGNEKEIYDQNLESTRRDYELIKAFFGSEDR